ncbi:MAG TPA: class II fructose-bisphosphate aldolase [Fimbriimonas sp.]|nr:class II fructose-bisphosphate aldolase [Fimbriimonas sp.]
MPVADPLTFAAILDRASSEHYALASINVTSSNTANAALAGFVEANADGIIQISTGGGEHASGPAKDMALGAIALAEHVHCVAAKLDVTVAITTDHCVPGKLEKFVVPLIDNEERRKANGQRNLFNGFMFDGSELPLKENMEVAQGLLRRMAPLGLILEVEAGLVGGEEDGIDNTGAHHAKLYTTPDDMLYVYESLKDLGRFNLAATFGNVHGVYKPGNVKLMPTILRDGNAAVTAKYGPAASLDLVFHGGSGSLLSEIHETLEYGVVKMNVDTDCQYAFSRPIADHMFKNYDGVLRVDGEMGDKKVYDPRSYIKKAEAGMKARVIQACQELNSAGKSLAVAKV